MTREEAIYRLKNTAWLGTDEDREQTEQAVGMAIEALQREENLLKSLETNEPIYDMVDVVRCKDCRHRYEEGDCTHYYWCRINDRPIDDTDFCAWGELKGGEDE
jgi:hypothetical protein